MLLSLSLLNFLWSWLGCDMFAFRFIWALYRHSCVLPCTAHALQSSIHTFLVCRVSTPEPRQSLGAKRRSRMYAWRLCPGRTLGKSSCLPRRLYKQIKSKSSSGTGAFFSITVCYDFFPFLASAVFYFILFICAFVNGIHFSMSSLLHFSLLPARRLTHAVIHGRITGAASAFEA